MLLLTLRGTPTLYYGDEIGMRDVPIPPDRVQDPWEKNLPGRGLGRDPERTPMQWSAEPSAGFTTRRALAAPRGRLRARSTWPRSGSTPPRCSPCTARCWICAAASPRSPSAAGRRVDAEGDVLAYLRSHGDSRFLIALNLGAEPASLAFGGAGETVLSTLAGDRARRVEGTIDLRGDEGVIVRLA